MCTSNPNTTFLFVKSWIFYQLWREGIVLSLQIYNLKTEFVDMPRIHVANIL
jgi:hypothetical protein